MKFCSEFILIKITKGGTGTFLNYINSFVFNQEFNEYFHHLKVKGQKQFMNHYRLIDMIIIKFSQK